MVPPCPPQIEGIRIKRQVAMRFDKERSVIPGDMPLIPSGQASQAG